MGPAACFGEVRGDVDVDVGSPAALPLQAYLLAEWWPFRREQFLLKNFWLSEIFIVLFFGQKSYVFSHKM